MAETDEQYPQDDATARATLLAWLEGELPLDEAAARYAACFPPVARMDPSRVKRTWEAWNPARKKMLAAQIRTSMEQ
jgi:hypothetical protein